ncbi:MAG TPA: hypothetical protein VF744_04020 [Beijerinckiaceae bacterium]|jgi:hypothetical protein
MRTVGLAIAAFLTCVAAGDAAPLRCGGVLAHDRIVARREGARCPWAFKADTVMLLCLRHGGLQGVFVEVAGKRYPLNGDARQLAGRVAYVGDLAEIAVKGPAGKADLSEAWIQDGLALCRAGGTMRW